MVTDAVVTAWQCSLIDDHPEASKYPTCLVILSYHCPMRGACCHGRHAGCHGDKLVENTNRCSNRTLPCTPQKDIICTYKHRDFL